MVIVDSLKMLTKKLYREIDLILENCKNLRTFFIAVLITKSKYSIFDLFNITECNLKPISIKCQYYTFFVKVPPLQSDSCLLVCNARDLRNPGTPSRVWITPLRFPAELSPLSFRCSVLRAGGWEGRQNRHCAPHPTHLLCVTVNIHEAEIRILYPAPPGEDGRCAPTHCGGQFSRRYTEHWSCLCGLFV